MAFTPFVETDAPTMAAFNEKFAQAIAEAEGGAIEKGTKNETGNYVGTDKSGASNPTSLTLGFEPKFVAISWVRGSMRGMLLMTNTSGLCFEGAYTSVTSPYPLTNVSVSGNKITWYSDNGSNFQANYSGVTYNYIAIG